MTAQSVEHPPEAVTASRDPIGLWRRFASYSYRVPNSVPYWGTGAYAALFGSILAGRVVRGPGLDALSHNLADRLAVPGVLLFGSGRAAIEAGFRAAGLGKGAEVVVPSFCCRSVLTPVLAVGAQPVFADAGPELNVTRETIEPRLTPRTRAVLVSHLFGNPAEIDAIVQTCGGRDILVVDDAAQALGADSGGRAVGTLGDWGILSFGNGKICMGTGGGVLLSRDAGFIEAAGRVPRIQPRAGDAVARAMSTLVWRRWRRWTLPLRAAWNRLLGETDERMPQQVSGPRNVDAAVALALLGTLRANLQARRERSRAYAAGLAQESRVRLIPHRDGSACLSQVICVEPESADGATADRVRLALMSAGYEVSRSYKPLHLAEADGKGVEARQRMGIDLLWPKLLELPCEPSVALDDVARICEIIRRHLR